MCYGEEKVVVNSCLGDTPRKLRVTVVVVDNEPPGVAWQAQPLLYCLNNLVIVLLQVESFQAVKIGIMC